MEMYHSPIQLKGQETFKKSMLESIGSYDSW
jgi:hypothetical protein